MNVGGLRLDVGFMDQRYKQLEPASRSWRPASSSLCCLRQYAGSCKPPGHFKAGDSVTFQRAHDKTRYLPFTLIIDLWIVSLPDC